VLSAAIRWMPNAARMGVIARAEASAAHQAVVGRLLRLAPPQEVQD